MDAYRANLKAVLVLDGSGTDHVTTKALASRRLEVAITGPGGHSWSDFGMVNPINALVRAAVRFINTKVSAAPRTTFNLGQIEGGTSVNSIPHESRLKVDIRSESEDELTRLEAALRDCAAAGVRDEMESARDRSKGRLEWKVELLGSRPGGELASVRRYWRPCAARMNFWGITLAWSGLPRTQIFRYRWALTLLRLVPGATAAERIRYRSGMTLRGARWD